MAELRTIQNVEIRNFPDRGDLLQLDDSFSVIPYPFQSLGLEIPGKDVYILVLGPSGVFLISYHIIYLYESSEHFLTLVYNMEQTSEVLYKYLVRYCPFLPEFQLLMVVNDGNLQGPASQRVNFTPWRKLKTEIEAQPFCLDPEQIVNILDILKANLHYQRIHKYQILCILKREEHQVKFLAMDLVENRQVFIKEVNMPSDLGHLNRNAIVRGAKLSQELNHENIIQVERIFPLDNKIYIVTEWHEGGITLRQYMDNHPGTIPLPTAMELIRDLCRALMTAHDQGIVHRNLNADSLLVTPDHRLKVFNFDLAKKSGINTLQSTDLKQLSEENPYSAPEYVVGTHDVDQRVDVYSVGIIFYELLTGKRPTHYEERDLIPPSRIIQGLPTYIDTLIAKAIKFSREQRISTLHAFYDALDTGVSDLIDSRYELQDHELKRTEMSLIYKAKDLRTQKYVALKKVIFTPPKERPVPTRAERLEILRNHLEPIQLLIELEHVGLVKILDTLIEDDDAYIVMEWIEGRTLREELARYSQNEGLPEEYVLNIGLQLSETLQFIHKSAYVHGDIKPENVMLTADQKVILLDFIPHTLETEPSLVHQTPRYVAPEVLNKQNSPNEASDIFSLGIMLYELLARTFPYEVSDLQQNFKTGRFPQAIGLDQKGVIVRASLSEAIMQAVVYFPQERFKKFKTFQDHLGEVTQEPETHFEMPRLSKIHLPEIKLEWMLTLAFTLTLLMMGLYFTQGWYDETMPKLQEVYYE